MSPLFNMCSVIYLFTARFEYKLAYRLRALGSHRLRRMTLLLNCNREEYEYARPDLNLEKNLELYPVFQSNHRSQT